MSAFLLNTGFQSTSNQEIRVLSTGSHTVQPKIAQSTVLLATISDLRNTHHRKHGFNISEERLAEAPIPFTPLETQIA